MKEPKQTPKIKFSPQSNISGLQRMVLRESIDSMCRGNCSIQQAEIKFLFSQFDAGLKETERILTWLACPRLGRRHRRHLLNTAVHIGENSLRAVKDLQSLGVLPVSQ